LIDKTGYCSENSRIHLVEGRPGPGCRIVHLEIRKHCATYISTATIEAHFVPRRGIFTDISLVPVGGFRVNDRLRLPPLHIKTPWRTEVEPKRLGFIIETTRRSPRKVEIIAKTNPFHTISLYW
jgi:hypothetical protein